MKIAIIGAGPIGLYTATRCEKAGVDYDIFEADTFIGGQLTHLYPQKEIVNIPGIEKITATGYILTLFSQINPTKLHLATKIDDLGSLKQNYDYIIVATGIGTHEPRKLGLENEENCNVLYSVGDIDIFKDKRIVIFGGGDSALDWAAQLSGIAEKTTLVHRRDEFRGNADTIDGCDITIYKSFVPHKITKHTVSIKSVKDDSIVKLPYDYVLVNFGLIYKKQQFIVDDNVYFVGDCLDKTRTIAFGIESADNILNQILNN